MNNKMVLTDDLTATLVGEVLLLGLLGRALYQEPDIEWLNNLVAEDVFSESPFGAEQIEIVRGLEILQKWSREQAGGISDQNFTDLRMDYTGLFIGLGSMPAVPWESVYFNRERLVFQEQTIQVRNWYARFGMQIEQINKEPDDHIGLEVLFVAHLASLGLRAIEQADDKSLDDVLQAQHDFLSEHLLRWGPAWANLAKEHASTDFYRGIAHLTHGAMLAAAAMLQIKLPKVASL
jgi:TorA maturation chaperone TorD